MPFSKFVQRHERRLRRQATTVTTTNHERGTTTTAMRGMLQGAGWTLGSLVAAVHIEAYAHQFLYWVRPQWYRQVQEVPNGLTVEQLAAVQTSLPSTMTVVQALSTVAVPQQQPEEEDRRATSEQQQQQQQQVDVTFVTPPLSGPLWTDDDNDNTTNSSNPNNHNNNNNHTNQQYQDGVTLAVHHAALCQYCPPSLTATWVQDMMASSMTA